MDTIDITILIPCKEPQPDYFQLAIDSVFAQTSRHWRCIVIDDRSSDIHSLEKIDSVRRLDDPRIKVIKSKSPMVTGALNSGMAAAETPFVCALHCDDLLDKQAIKVLSASIKAFPEVDYFHSARRHIDDNGEIISGQYDAIESFTLEDFKHRGQAKHLHCWRVAFANQIGGMDESLGPHGADDYDFPWSMAEAGATFKAIQECLYYYRDHRSHFRLTTHIPLEDQITELKKIWKKHGMSADEIALQIEIRTSRYLQQAIYKDSKDKIAKEKANYSAEDGWRQTYRK